MYEEAVREQLEAALRAGIDHDEIGEQGPDPQIATLRDYGMLTSDEGLVLSYPDGSVFTVNIGCYRRPVDPDVREVA
ncbi:MAG: hypothetical protein ACRDPE_15285 [Solirubrobacterales bacterium]